MKFKNKFLTRAFFLFIVITSILGLSTSHPTGAPEETCTTFKPNHTGHQVQSSRSKYELSVTPSTVAPGGTVTVTLKGDTFKGFFIQGEDGTQNAVGKFKRQSKGQTVDCSGPGSANAITHVNADDKTTLSFQWTAPASFRGVVKFRAVAVKTYEMFWNNIVSNQLTVA